MQGLEIPDASELVRSRLTWTLGRRQVYILTLELSIGRSHCLRCVLRRP